MIRSPAPHDAGRRSPLPLTAAEYRLLADLLLNHIGTDPVQNDSLNYLAQRLFMLAVQAERCLAQA
ncbi:hypothetical protein ACI3L1_17595 [Deinococcus sp. SM5_A1]|uniref:hypothetical protein n=1 Tax=Deinococcus sp. SM5_A1 TaxID=3379094 RepID=UPI00385A1F97